MYELDDDTHHTVQVMNYSDAGSFLEDQTCDYRRFQKQNANPPLLGYHDGRLPVASNSITETPRTPVGINTIG